MKHTILGLLAGSALIVGCGVASAQDASTKIMDGNNPAPNYSASATGQASTTSTKIMDGNNPAPTAAPSATGKNLDKSTKIMDGNNPSPNYAASSTAKPVKTAHKAGSAQHTSHHKAHTPAT